jgi:aryl-alcohol dehydrogenase-like predicted oxidoreductase
MVELKRYDFSISVSLYDFDMPHRQRKIRYIGFSELSAKSLRRACAVDTITALQMEYSPFEMGIESPKTQVLSTTRELGVALVAYSPLGHGFMSGKYKSPDDFEEGDWRIMVPRFSKENFPKNLDLLYKFEEIASKKRCTSTQLCLAWLLAQGDDIFPIPG